MSFLNKYTRPALTKQDIKVYPFEEFAEASLEELEAVAEQHKIQQYNSWMMPQLLARFGEFKIVETEGQIDAAKTIMHNIKSDPKLRGMYLAATKLPRSKLIKRQNSAEGSHYGALIPLVMAGIKKYQNIPYSRWNREGIKYVADKNLAAAMLVEEVPELTTQRILEIREEGLTTKSGKNPGEVKNPLATWSLTGIGDTELGHLPKLAVTMITQIWLAHPSLRNQYMILDPVNWDSMPKPLMPTSVLPPKEPKVTPPQVIIPNHDLPWDVQS
jgi:hypothetical protein